MFAVLVAATLFAKDLVIVSVLQSRYVREQFDLLGVFFLLLVSFVVILTLLSGVMPWSLPHIIVAIIKRDAVARPLLNNADYFLLLLLYGLVIVTVNGRHKAWRGLKSVRHHQQDQRGETTNFIFDGVGEFKRIVIGSDPLPIYSPLQSKIFIDQLEPVTDSLAWKDQVKELIRLTSSSYAFDDESGWHDKEGCWIGRNVDTEELVFLYPFQKLSKPLFESFLEYAWKISIVENKPIGEIIAASKEQSWRPFEKWQNITIRYEDETSLLNRLVDFKDYFSEIKRRVCSLPLPDSNLTLHDVYVPSKFMTSDESESRISIEDYLNEWLSESGQRQLAVLGEYGQGKSTATLMWVYHQITKKRVHDERIPLLIELRGTSPRNLTPLTLLGAWSAQYNLNAQALMRLLIAGRLVLIFEGFDEMALIGDSEMRLKHFRTLWQFAYPKAKILITGRPNFFLDEEELKAALGISKPIAGRPYCQALRLSPFKPQQIRDALRSYNSTVQGQIYGLSKKGGKFLELVSRPSLLHIVAVLWERDRLHEKVDQLTSAYVMDLFVRHSYRRQGLKELDSPEFMALTSLEREYFMSGIAAYMAHERLPNQITGIQLNDLIVHLIECIPDAVSTESSAISGETTQPLRERLRETDYGVDHVKTDVRACGLLIDDPASSGTFRFGHKSFMEYLFAALLYEYTRERVTDKTKSLMVATAAEVIDLLKLPESIDFLSELLKAEGLNDAKSKSDAATARRLFNVVFESGRLLRIPIRVVVFMDVISLCLSSLASSIRRKLLIQTLFPFMPIIIIFLGSALFFKKPSPLFFAWATGLMTLLMFSFSITVLSQRKMNLWSKLCTKMDLSNEALHIALRTSAVPWVRKQPLSFAEPNFSSLLSFLILNELELTRLSGKMKRED